MAAIVNIKRWCGSSGTASGSVITSINTVANACDYHQESAAASADPIKVPTSGTHYSYWVSTRLATGVTGPSGTINNLRWYTDGSNSFGTGITCKVAEAHDYTQATGTQGVTGNQLTAVAHGHIDEGPSDAFGKTSGSPLSLDGSCTTANTDFGDYVVYQLEVDNTASAGVTGQEAFTWLYDES